MNPITQWFVGMVCAVALFPKAQKQPAGNISATEPPNAVACAAAEYHQFDFWGGDWDAFEIDGSTPVARVRVDRILEGCALRKEYEDTSGKKEQSFSIYDASRKGMAPELGDESWTTAAD